MIRFIQLDDINREFSLVDGVYNQEYDSNKTWIWTSQNFGGIVSNISHVTMTINSDIQNTLYYDDISVQLYPNCVNVVKLNTIGKKTFEVKLANPFIANNDPRKLGVKITRIVLDQDVIF
jgi:hypothetical protein